MDSLELIIDPDSAVFEMSPEKREKLLETGAIYWSDVLQVYVVTEKMFNPTEVRLLMTCSE